MQFYLRRQWRWQLYHVSLHILILGLADIAQSEMYVCRETVVISYASCCLAMAVSTACIVVSESSVAIATWIYTSHWRKYIKQPGSRAMLLTRTLFVNGRRNDFMQGDGSQMTIPYRYNILPVCKASQLQDCGWIDLAVAGRSCLRV